MTHVQCKNSCFFTTPHSFTFVNSKPPTCPTTRGTPVHQRLAGISLSLTPLPDEQGATALALSSDELCLAVLTGHGQVLCYSLPVLANPHLTAPQPVSIPADTSIAHFVWCKGAASASQTSSFLYVTHDRELYVGMLGVLAPILVCTM